MGLIERAQEIRDEIEQHVRDLEERRAEHQARVVASEADLEARQQHVNQLREDLQRVDAGIVVESTEPTAGVQSEGVVKQAGPDGVHPEHVETQPDGTVVVSDEDPVAKAKGLTTDSLATPSPDARKV